MGTFALHKVAARFQQLGSTQHGSGIPTQSTAMKRSGAYLYTHFDLPSLRCLAGELRNVACFCDDTTEPKSGSWSWTIFLVFEDGVEWAFLSPRTDHGFTSETITKLLDSQVATMKYVKSNSSIPVPEVFYHSSSPINKIGVPFILMSKAQGCPLSRFTWNPPLKGMKSNRAPRPCLRRWQKEKIMAQLGVVISQLLNLRFDKIGSLFERDGEYVVEECLSPALLWNGRESLGADVLRGPFQHYHEYYESLLSAFLLHVKELPIEQHSFFDPIPEVDNFTDYSTYKSAVDIWNRNVTNGKINSSMNRLDYCVVGRFLKGMIPAIDHRSSNTFGKGYPLGHPDLNLSNIFTDDDLNITCIIDWQFSSTVPIATHLTTPSLPHPRDKIDYSLAPTFRASCCPQYLPELTLVPEFWESARRAWLFARLVTLDGLQDRRFFEELFVSVYEPQGEINIERLFKSVREEEDFGVLKRELSVDWDF